MRTWWWSPTSITCIWSQLKTSTGSTTKEWSWLKASLWTITSYSWFADLSLFLFSSSFKNYRSFKVKPCWSWAQSTSSTWRASSLLSRGPPTESKCSMNCQSVWACTQPTCFWTLISLSAQDSLWASLAWELQLSTSWATLESLLTKQSLISTRQARARRKWNRDAESRKHVCKEMCVRY